MKRLAPASGVVFGAVLVGHALAQDYDFDWAVVDRPGNAAYQLDDPTGFLLRGRGSVSYTFRISRLETTSAQWVEFFNAFAGNSSPHPFWNWTPPSHWGGYKGSDGRYHVFDGDGPMLPVAGVSWRMSALYCNWLNNGKSLDPASLATGAYDTSTWGSNGHNFTDAFTHLPDAKFWIPTFDEQLKAMQFDPDRYGPGQSGWWMARNRSDVAGIPGPPGVGTTSAGWDTFDAWNVPLGAYKDSQSPWGLWDTSGGAAEWNERVFWESDPTERGWAGSNAGTYPFTDRDLAWDFGSARPNAREGIRVAGAVPAPWSAFTIVLCLVCGSCRRRQEAVLNHDFVD